MTAYKILLSVHGLLGVLALLTYWIAALARKGSGPHKLAGKVYVLVMVALLVPAVPLSIRLGLNSPVFGVFFAYLLLITASALWKGWYAVRRKRDFAAYAGTGYRRLAWANIAGGLAILVLGLVAMQPILIGFSAVGLLGGRGMLGVARRGPAHPRWWMEQHLGAMIGCGVATHIAFLLVGLPRLLPALSGPGLQTAAWLSPLVLAAIARRWLGRRFLPPPAARGLAGATAA